MQQLKFILVTLVILVFKVNYSQKNNKADSLFIVYNSLIDEKEKVKILSKIYYSYLYNNPKEAKRIAEKELQLAQKIKFTSAIGTANHHLGNYYQNINNLDSARYYYQKALSIHKKLKNVSNQTTTLANIAQLDHVEGKYDEAIIIYNNIISIHRETGDNLNLALDYLDKANVYTDKGNYRIALEDALKSLEILDSINAELYRKADVFRQIGAIHHQLKNYSKSVEYNKQALKIYVTQKDNMYAAYVYNELGYTFYELSDYKRAIEYIKMSLSLSKDLKLANIEGISLTGLGIVYSEQGLNDKALLYLNKALKIHQNNKYINNIAQTLLAIGDVYSNTNNYKKAIAYYSKSIVITDSIGLVSYTLTAYQKRAIQYENIDEYRKAISDYKKSKSLNDSIYSITKLKQIEELQTLFETNTKEKEITIQANKIKLLEQKAKTDTIKLFFIIAGFTLSTIILGLIFYALKQKTKRQKYKKEIQKAGIKHKQKELVLHTQLLAQKKDALDRLKQRMLLLMEGDKNVDGYKQLIQSIDHDLNDKTSIKKFNAHFEETHKEFIKLIKQTYPNLTANEFRLLALIKMNLSSKEIANTLNISQEGIKKARYRLRKKLNMPSDTSLKELTNPL